MAVSSRFHANLARFSVVLGVVAALVVIVFWGRLQEEFAAASSADGVSLRGPPLTPVPCTDSVGPRPGRPFTVSVDPIALRHALVTGLTGAVDSALTEYTNRLACDIHAEWNLMAVYDAFRVRDPALLAALGRWVAEEPQAPGPRIARAAYYTEAGWRARDVRAALQLDPRVLAAYWLIIEHTQAGGQNRLGRVVLDRALQVWPLSVQLRLVYMHELEPRWGGSYDAMTELAIQAESLAERNPELLVLRGYASWERGRTAREDGDTVGSVAWFDEAVTHGTYPLFLADRGESLAELGRLEAAAADFDRALTLWPAYA